MLFSLQTMKKLGLTNLAKEKITVPPLKHSKSAGKGSDRTTTSESEASEGKSESSSSSEDESDDETSSEDSNSEKKQVFP